MSKRGRVAGLVQETTSQHGKVGILVNNTVIVPFVSQDDRSPNGGGPSLVNLDGAFLAAA